MLVKLYTRKELVGKAIKDDTILVGAGAGGALAVGMVSKALQELGHLVPKSIVMDCEYISYDGWISIYPETATLFPEGLNLPDERCLIVHSYLGTGRSLKMVRTKCNLEKAPVFSFVVSKALQMREKVNYHIIIGDRELIPWPRSEPHPKLETTPPLEPVLPLNSAVLGGKIKEVKAKSPSFSARKAGIKKDD